MIATAHWLAKSSHALSMAFTLIRFQSKTNTFLSISVFSLHQNVENANSKLETRESRDQSGELENGPSENNCVNRGNEYFNDYEGQYNR